MDYATDQANRQLDANAQTHQLQEALDDVDEVHVMQDMSPEALQKMLQGRLRALKLCERFNVCQISPNTLFLLFSG